MTQNDSAPHALVGLTFAAIFGGLVACAVEPTDPLTDDVGAQGGNTGGQVPVSGNNPEPGNQGGSNSMNTAGASQNPSPTPQGGQGGNTAGMGGSNPNTGPFTPPKDAPEGSPAYRWGQLQVCGSRLCDQRGNRVQLKGVSSMWLNWENDGFAESREALRWMRDNWKLTVIRAAMGVEPAGGYLQDPARMRSKMIKIVQNAIAEGVYVIVDWHDHNAHNHMSQAKSFFNEMAQMFGDKPNVLWETFNEPLKVSWSGVLKPYHRALIDTIRARDPDNIILLGTPNWSQDVEAAVADKLDGTNLMYTLHFYSCTHLEWLRKKASYATDYELPLFVTEWGATHADGGLDGRVCQEEAQTWHTWLNEHGVSWAAWKLDNCTPDSSCILNPGAPVNGPWTDQWLRGHGAFVRDKMRN